MKNSFILFTFLCLAAAYTECYGGLHVHRPLRLLLKTEKSQKQYKLLAEDLVSKKDLPVFVGPQEGGGEDEIEKLPGQPHVKFNQFSGYVTFDPNAGRALFYYFTEAENATNKPLVLWLNGGPGCSSVGYGAMSELGPFRVNPDGKTLKLNQYAWNKVANVLFLESPAGVGFSYSNRSSDYVTGGSRTALDSYTFLVNWFERFPEYKTRDLFLAGESYAGHYLPQLAELILHRNNNTKHNVIKLKGIVMGNAYIDFTDRWAGTFDYFWTHALISDEVHQAIINNCNFSSMATVSDVCENYMDRAFDESGDIDIYDIYGPLCGSNATTPSTSSFDPCTDDYVAAYLNRPEVQEALHANVTNSLPGPWQHCNDPIFNNWTDQPKTVLPVIKKLMDSGISFWIYSGDTDGVISVTTTKYSMAKLGASIITPWYPWYHEEEVGGYALGYENVTFVTVRGAGHVVPSKQPGRALTFFTSFLKGELPPKEESAAP